MRANLKTKMKTTSAAAKLAEQAKRGSMRVVGGTDSEQQKKAAPAKQAATQKKQATPKAKAEPKQATPQNPKPNIAKLPQIEGVPFDQWVISEASGKDGLLRRVLQTMAGQGARQWRPYMEDLAKKQGLDFQVDQQGRGTGAVFYLKPKAKVRATKG